MKIRLLILLLMITLVKSLPAQLLPPEPVSIFVNDDGSVTLSWNKPADVTGFISYSVFYAPDESFSFTQIATITDPDQGDITHANADANSRSRYYFMTTNYTGGSSAPTDTLQTIFLMLNTPDQQIVFLEWNAIHDPPFPTSNVRYEVWREYPPGSWILMATTQVLTKTELFPFCNHDGVITNYRIRTNDPSVPLSSQSNLSGSLLADNNPPYEIPVMDSVSVTADGQVIIGWEEGLTPDIAGYVIYHVTSINDPIDTVPGKSTTTFADPEADPCEGPYRYIMSAIDSCGNNGLLSQDLPQQTIWLKDIGFDPCAMTASLSWTRYINFEPDLEGYRIYVSENGGPFNLHTTIPHDTTYLHTDLLPNTSYTYFIRAFTFNNEKTSSSCRKTINTFEAPLPEYTYFRFATVGEDNTVGLMVHIDTSAWVGEYLVERAESIGGPYAEIARLPAGEPDLAFTDVEASVQELSYYYRVTAIDSCGRMVTGDNYARTMLLQGEARADQTNYLHWNAYESWQGDVNGYNIWRRKESDLMGTIVGNTGPSGLEYSDDVSTLGDLFEPLYYRIEALEGPGNSLGYQEVSFSNEIKVVQEPILFIPNAFAPRGTNNRLKPSMVFVQEDGYLFSIYNRWGQLIFQTSDPGDSWDGTANGRYVQQDVYVYSIRFRDPEGGYAERHGTVAVIF